MRFIIGKTSIRKRVTTLKNELNSIRQSLGVNIKSEYNVKRIKYCRSLVPFEKATISDELIAMATKASEYPQRDVRYSKLFYFHH